MAKTCFVIMSIGDIVVNEITITAKEQKDKYDALIKEAIQKAIPDCEITRADDVAMPGTITSDIITRIMHSDFVIADVSYPNPNVFYELGLRHASKSGTIIIKDSNSPKSPFDIAHLRYIEYNNTPAGITELATNLNRAFDHYKKNPLHPDSHFLELAKLTKYSWPEYGKTEVAIKPEVELMMSVLQNPELMTLLMRQSSGEEVPQQELLGALMKNPNATRTIIEALSESNELNILPTSTPIRKPNRAERRKK